MSIFLQGCKKIKEWPGPWGWGKPWCRIMLGLGKLSSKTVLLCYAPMLLTGFIMLLRYIMLHMNHSMPTYNIIHDQRLPCGWTLTYHVSVGKHARPSRLRCYRCHHTDRRFSYSLIRLSILQTVSPWCCMFSLLLFLLMNIQFSANSTIMLLDAASYWTYEYSRCYIC